MSGRVLFSLKCGNFRLLQQTTFINSFSLFFRKIGLDVSSESSARQRIHMKNQALLLRKIKVKELKRRLLQFMFGALRVKCFSASSEMQSINTIAISLSL